MATINLGKIRPTFGGDWNSTATYAELTYVRYLNGYYISKEGSVNANPSTRTDKWDLITSPELSILNVKSLTDTKKTYSTKYIETNFGRVDRTIDPGQIPNGMITSDMINSGIITNINNKVAKVPGATSKQFYRGDGSVTYKNILSGSLSTSYDCYDNPGIIKFDHTDLKQGSIDLEKSVGNIIVPPGFYNLSVSLGLESAGSKRPETDGNTIVIHIFNVTSNTIVKSTFVNTMENSITSVNIQDIVPGNQVYCVKIEYYGEKMRIIGDSVSSPTPGNTKSIYTKFSISQID